ncbi:NAD-GH domain containing protein [Oxalobacteraceae bacterium CAVE-383]|nr:NAD-GH domain containing protein [Oxalobacteraceae bacterium CAVE-383]
MIKTFFASAVILTALGGCMTPQTTANNPPGEVPASRIHIKEMVNPAAGPNEVKVIRDAQWGWGVNPLEFSVNYVVLAELLPGEAVSAWLPDGEYTFSVKPGNNPQRLEPRIVTLKLQKGQKHTLRIGGGEFNVTMEEVGAK